MSDIQQANVPNSTVILLASAARTANLYIMSQIN